MSGNSPSLDVDFETALEEKMKAVSDASFKCGEWNSDDLDSYDVLLEASEKADDALMEFVKSALTRAREEERQLVLENLRSLHKTGNLSFSESAWNSALGSVGMFLYQRGLPKPQEAPPETTTDER